MKNVGKKDLNLLFHYKCSYLTPPLWEGEKMQLQESGLGKIIKLLRSFLGPLLLLTVCPPLVMLVWYTNVSLNGSIDQLCALFAKDGVFSTIYQIWSPLFFGTIEAWKILIVFAAVE